MQNPNPYHDDNPEDDPEELDISLEGLDGLAQTSGHVGVCIPRELRDPAASGTSEDYPAIVNIIMETDAELDDWGAVRKFLIAVTMEMLRDDKWSTSMERLLRLYAEAQAAAEKLNSLARERAGFEARVQGASK